MRSMTGFGKSEGDVGNMHYTFEIKSVNHRFLDARFRLPPMLSQFEFPLSEVLKKHFERGSFEVSCRQRLNSSDGHAALGTRFVVDEIAARSLVDGCHWLHQTFQTERIPSLEVFAMSGRVFLPVEDTQDVSALGESLKEIFEKAVAELKKMREAEGKRIATVLEGGIHDIEKNTKQVSELAKTQPARIKEKLDQRLENWKLTAPVDAQRLEWEVAILADKSDITEETDRLSMHCVEYLKNLKNDKPSGRKLDFLTQELHREVNTIASKSNSIEITKCSVELKTVIERLREQVQNVE